MVARPRRDLPVPLPVEVQGPNGSPNSEYAVNLSSGGICLHLREPLPVGSTVQVCFDLPSGGSRIEARARVVWFTREEERGTGVQFCEVGLRFETLGSTDGERIDHYVRQPFE
jgi:uncharacterized protein (TIGR02266 family)